MTRTYLTTTYRDTRRHELEPGQVFRCLGGVVMLESRVAGDGTKWHVLDWHDGWCTCDSQIEPGDLKGEPLPNDEAVITAAAAAAAEDRLSHKV
jgi:hypothetical protein